MPDSRLKQALVFLMLQVFVGLLFGEADIMAFLR